MWCKNRFGSKRVLVWECLFNPENLLLTRNETDILLRTVSSRAATWGLLLLLSCPDKLIVKWILCVRGAALSGSSLAGLEGRMMGRIKNVRDWEIRRNTAPDSALSRSPLSDTGISNKGIQWMWFVMSWSELDAFFFDALIVFYLHLQIKPLPLLLAPCINPPWTDHCLCGLPTHCGGSGAECRANNGGMKILEEIQHL